MFWNSCCFFRLRNPRNVKDWILFHCIPQTVHYLESCKRWYSLRHYHFTLKMISFPGISVKFLDQNAFVNAYQIFQKAIVGILSQLGICKSEWKSVFVIDWRGQWALKINIESLKWRNCFYKNIFVFMESCFKFCAYRA